MWEKEPGDVSACGGHNVTMPWKYLPPGDKQFKGYYIIKDTSVIQTILMKNGDSPLEIRNKRASFNESIGLTLSNVTKADSGKYQFGVLYEDIKSTSDGHLSVIGQ